jgi:hypothetical protein
VRRREALAVAGKVAKPGNYVAADLLDRGSAAAGARLEHYHAADVHMGALVRLLELEEGRVKGGELIRHSLPPIGGSADNEAGGHRKSCGRHLAEVGSLAAGVVEVVAGELVEAAGTERLRQSSDPFPDGE